MVDYGDIVNFTHDELREEYCKLFDRFQELSESNEADSQTIYELKRSLDTAVAAQEYLSQELEQYTNTDGNEVEKELHKTQTELGELKKNYRKLEISFNTLQQDYNAQLDVNAGLSKNLEEALKQRKQIPNNGTKICEEELLRMQMLENENMDLLAKIESFEERSVRYTLNIAEYEKNVEILRDQIKCLEENLESKRAKLEETLQILESTQEQLAEANAKIAMLSSTSDSDNRKGNSLFAEVDDQRQVMKQLLAAQKKSYLQMKKVFNESEYEIRRLKRENISMHAELETCSLIFCNADKVYQEKLNERVRHLFNQNEELERKLKWTQERLQELASEKKVTWLDSMFSFCKKETDDLKTQLHSVRIQNAGLEEQLRNSQQDMVRWRFESLKSRCILLDREHLLTENNISFKPIHAMEYNISENDQQKARPRIVSRRTRSSSDNSVDDVSLILKQTTAGNKITPQIIIKQEIPGEEEISNIIKTKYDEQSAIVLNQNEIIQSDDKLLCREKPLLTCNVEGNNESLKLNRIENKENAGHYSESSENSPLLNKFAKLKANSPSPMRPLQRNVKTSTNDVTAPPVKSILTKYCDSLVKDFGKNVKFSQKVDIVHNLSPESSSSTSTTELNSTQASNSTANKTNNKTAVKSGVVVRRIFINSKHD